MNDIAHTTYSSWSFWAGSDHTGTLRAEISIEIVRGEGPVPLAPPHPDFWGSNSTLVRYDAKGPLFEVFGFGRFVRPQTQPPGFLRLAGPIPFGTEEVQVVFAYNSSTDPAFHYRPLLSWFAGKTGQSYLAPTEARFERQNGWIAWRVPVEPKSWDSPYAATSLWNVHLDWMRTHNTHGLGYQALMDGDFHLWMTIHRDSAAKAA